MDIFKTIMDHAGDVDLGAIGQKVGLSPDQVQAGAGSLLAKLHGEGADPGQAAADTAAETGLDVSKLQALLPMLGGLVGSAQANGAEGATGGLGDLLGKLGGGQGVVDGISKALDRDGDGNPLNDLMGMAQGLFRKP